MKIFTKLLFTALLTVFLLPQTLLADDAFTQNRTDFRDESIYFLMTTRFYDGDPTNNVLCWDAQANQIANGDPCWRGDFAGVIDKLDYIKALGFTAIWITPIVQNASGFDYHGYHAMDFSKVDLRYESHKGKGKYGGATRDVTFQSLVDAAHAKGIKIILDIVLNHTGNFGENGLCKEFERSQNLLNQADINACMQPTSLLPSNYIDLPGKNQYAHRLALMKNTDGQNHDTKNYWHHYGNFNWDEPNRWWAQIAGDCVDLNTENPAVVDYLVKCYGEFIKMGVDGFRIDTSGHISRLTFNSTFIPKFQALGEQYKSKRLNQAPFFMYGEVCARFGGNVTYRGQANLSPWFYTWKSDQADISKFNSVTAADWAGVNVPEGSAEVLNMKDCLSDNAHSSEPQSTNAKMVNGAWHEPDYSEYSGFSIIDFPMHYNFNNANEAWGYRNSDHYYNDATYNVVYVDSHDYCPGPNDGTRFNGGTDTWAENLALMFTFRGIPCVYYGSEIEFRKGVTIDKGPELALKESGRAYFGGYITGDVNASDFGTYTASGNADATLSQDLSQHIIRLNKIRQAVPALRKGQWTTDGCSGSGIAFKRAYKDSYALVAINGGATFTDCPSGTYTDLVTGHTYTGSTITVSAPSNKGQVRVLVKDYTGKSGADLLGGDGKFIYDSAAKSVAKTSYDGKQENGTDMYITMDDIVGNAGVSFSPRSKNFTEESLTINLNVNECSSAWYSINGGAQKSIPTSGTTITIGAGDPADTQYVITWGATTNDGETKSGSETYKKVGTYTPTCEEDEICVFYESDATAVSIWVWNDNANFTGGKWDSKPNMEFMGISTTGKNVFKWTYDGSETSMPTKVIFLPGGTQSSDLAYKNHGYYIDNVYDHEVEAGAAKPSYSVDKQSQAFNGSISVTITPKNGATVVYTTNGQEPTASSTQTTANKTLTFTATTTLKVGLLTGSSVSNVKTYTYTYQEAPTGITIYVKSSTAPNLYVWDDNQNKLNGEWPGNKMTQTKTVGNETYYYQTFTAESINIIFNNGNGGQTADIKGVTKDTYYTWNGSNGYSVVTPGGGDDPNPPTQSYTYTVTYEESTNWNPVYCYVWDNADGNKYLGEWPGQQMSKSGNKWTITFTTDKELVDGKVIFNNGQGGNGNQTGDLNLSEYNHIATAIAAPTFGTAGQRIVIYSISGERVATVSDIREAEYLLRSGIYVINGRKFIVR